MRTLAAVDHRVADFDAWKEVYDSVRDLQRMGGVRYHQVLREASDPNRVYVTHVFDTREAAEVFFANEELKADMAKGGVDASSIKLMFFEEVEAGEL